MSHFVVLVVGENVKEQLKPFDENLEVPPYKRLVDEDDVKSLTKKWKPEKPADLLPHITAYYGEPSEYTDGKYFVLSTCNPRENGKWDWYAIGGRWTGFFLAKEGTRGEPGLMTKEATGNRFDVVRKGDVDFAAMRSAAGAKAQERWNIANDIIQKHGLPLPWKLLLEKHSVPEWEDCIKKFACEEENISDEERTRRVGLARVEYNTPLDKARDEHHAHPTQRALCAARLDLWGEDVADVYGIPLDEYVRRAEDDSLTPFAMLVHGKDGEGTDAYVWKQHGQDDAGGVDQDCLGRHPGASR